VPSISNLAPSHKKKGSIVSPPWRYACRALTLQHGMFVVRKKGWNVFAGAMTGLWTARRFGVFDAGWEFSGK